MYRETIERTLSQRSFGIREMLLLGAGFLFLLVLTVLFLPTAQTIGYGLLVGVPYLWWWGGLTVAGVGLGAYMGYERTTMGILAVGILMTLFIGPLMNDVYAKEHMLQNQAFEQRAELPETSSEHVRVLPRNVADSYADSSNQLPKYEMGDSDIAYNNGTYTWSYGVTPDRLAVVFMGNQWGAYYVDMEQTSRSIETSRTTMQNGMGMLWFDSYGYQVNVDRIDVDHRPETAFVFEHDCPGDVIDHDSDGQCTYIAQSHVTHDWEFRLLPIPQPYVVPEYSGTQVVSPNGTVHDLSPEQVAESEMLESQNTYPYGLATYRMSAMQYRNGVINKLFVGEGVPKIAETGGFSDNNQPFTVPTTADDGAPELDRSNATVDASGGATPELTYFIAATPAGSGDGIYQVYTIDGQTGSIEYVEFDNTLTGPKKAAGFTRSQNRAPNWAVNNEDGSTQITEPIPLVICDSARTNSSSSSGESDGCSLYWHMRVTPTDGARISYTTFVSADTGDVYRATSTDEIVSFIESGGSNVTDPGSTQNATDRSGTDAVVTVYLIEDGQVVDTMNITDPANQTVQISANATSSGPNAAA